MALTVLASTRGSPRAPRGWNRPVRPLALVLVGGVVLVLWLVLMTGAVWYFYEKWEARLTLHDQPVALRLPAGMPALAQVSSPLRTHIDLTPELRLPFKQTVTAQLSDQLQAQVRLHTVLPVDTSVTIDQMIPVDTTLKVAVPLNSWLPPIEVMVPVRLQLPLRMVVPVKAQVPVDLDLLVSGDLPPTVDIPIDTEFVLHPRVRGEVRADMAMLTEFRLVAPVAPFDLSIERAHLRVPFNLTMFRQRQP